MSSFKNALKSVQKAHKERSQVFHVDLNNLLFISIDLLHSKHHHRVVRTPHMHILFLVALIQSKYWPSREEKRLQSKSKVSTDS